jgi:hypothetical protein
VNFGLTGGILYLPAAGSKRFSGARRLASFDRRLGALPTPLHGVERAAPKAPGEAVEHGEISRVMAAPSMSPRVRAAIR